MSVKNKPRLLSVGSSGYYGTTQLANERDRSQLTVQLQTPFSVDQDEVIVMRCVGCSIPISFYGIDDLANKFGCSVKNVASGITYTKTVTLNEGTYSAIQLQTEIEGAINLAFATERTGGLLPISYNLVDCQYGLTTNIYAFTPGGGLEFSFDFTVADDCHRALGFYKDTVTSLTSTVLFSTRPVILTSQTTGNIFIFTDQSCAYRLPTTARMTSQASVQGVDNSQLLQVVPITVPPNSFQSMASITEVTPLILKRRRLSEFKIYLYNQDLQLLNLRGLNWEVTLQIQVQRLPEYELNQIPQLQDRTLSSYTFDRIMRINNPLTKKRRLDTDDSDLVNP